MHSNRRHKRFICFVVSYRPYEPSGIHYGRLVIFSKILVDIFKRLRKLEIFGYLLPSLFSKLKIYAYSNQFCVEKYEKLSSKPQREGKLIENIEDIR